MEQDRKPEINLHIYPWGFPGKSMGVGCHCLLECESRKSENTGSNRQIWPWNTEWSRAKTNRISPRKCTGHSKHPLHNTREDSIHGHHQMVNTKIRLIIFFAAKDGEALYSQQKQDQELTVAQIMSSLLPNSDLSLRKWMIPLDHSGMT